jgi:hypothetical protein
MILRGSAGRVCHLENVQFYLSNVQQCTKIIKMLTLKTYFSYIWSKLRRTRSQITYNLYVSNWKSSYDVNDVMLVMCQSRQWHFAEFFQFTIVYIFTVTQQRTWPLHLWLCKSSSDGKKLLFSHVKIPEFTSRINPHNSHLSI